MFYVFNLYCKDNNIHFIFQEHNKGSYAVKIYSKISPGMRLTAIASIHDFVSKLKFFMFLL